MYVMISRFITLFFCLCILCVPVAYGQVGITESDVSVGLFPENPKPLEPVTATIETYAFNLDTVNVRWYVDNQLATEGIGVKTLTFQVGDLGKQTNLRIIIDSPDGQIVKNIPIIPGTVSIVWEADTYTPPFFKGKALFSHQSVIRFLAQPEIIVSGRRLNPNTLVYTWTKDGTVLGSQSGYNKQTLTLIGSIISRSMRIMVEVRDPATGITGSHVITVNPIDPEISLYVVDPLYGVQYNNAITSTLSLAGKEVTLEAVPYFFSAPGGVLYSNLSYNWNINGITISDGQNTHRRVFRTVGDEAGRSQVGVKIMHEDRILQFRSFNTTIDFLGNTSNQQF